MYLIGWRQPTDVFKITVPFFTSPTSTNTSRTVSKAPHLKSSCLLSPVFLYLNREDLERIFFPFLARNREIVTSKSKEYSFSGNSILEMYAGIIIKYGDLTYCPKALIIYYHFLECRKTENSVLGITYNH